MRHPLYYFPSILPHSGSLACSCFPLSPGDPLVKRDDESFAPSFSSLWKDTYACYRRLDTTTQLRCKFLSGSGIGGMNVCRGGKGQKVLYLCGTLMDNRGNAATTSVLGGHLFDLSLARQGSEKGTCSPARKTLLKEHIQR